MKVFLLLWSGIFLQVQVNGVSFPPELHLCHKSDPNLNDCVKKSVQDGFRILANGYKPLGIGNLEPYNVEKIEIDGSQTGSVTLDQKYEDVTIFGTPNSTVISSDLDLDKCLWKLVVVTPKTIMKSNYVLKGQVLVFPINGHGKCEVTLKNVEAHHELKCKRIQKKDKTHLQFTEYNVALKPSDVVYDFKNIIPGNKAISDQILKTVNEHALSIFNDIRPGFEQVFATLYKTTLNNVFSKLPENELFLE